jgi:hypothetical protein
MRILPKKYFTWREPKSFLIVLDERDRANLRWWLQPLVAAAVAVMLLLNPKGLAPHREYRALPYAGDGA